MDEWTLQGKKKEVYALLKILKYAMDSDVKSYDAKYSVEMIFQNKEPSDIHGNALEEVLKHKNVRGHFNDSNVHPDLKKQGVTKIVLKDNGIDFQGNLGNFFISPELIALFYLVGKEDEEDAEDCCCMKFITRIFWFAYFIIVLRNWFWKWWTKPSVLSNSNKDIETYDVFFLS